MNIQNGSLEKLIAAGQHPISYLRELRRHRSKKIIGCFPMYVPEELIHAAGLQPAVLLVDTRMALDVAGIHVQTFFCGQIRALLELGLRKHMDFLDGMVFGDICEPVRLLGQIWRREKIPPFTWSIRYPVTINRRRSEEYLHLQFRQLQRGLEDLSGKKISQDEMEASIQLYNEVRKLLRDLYAMREEKPGLLSVVDFTRICTAAMSIPKEDFKPLAEGLLKTFEKKKAPGLNSRPRVFVWGVCGPPPEEFLKMIEEEGGTVVMDDLYVGNRYFVRDIRQNNSDPLAALAAFHFEQPPCVTRNRGVDTDLPRYLLERVERSHSQGVISVLHKYCDALGFEHPIISERLRSRGIAELCLELDQGVFTGEQTRTRVQAFLEMIGLECGNGK
jgi:benzoyl-CoA reductase subunit C